MALPTLSSAGAWLWGAFGKEIVNQTLGRAQEQWKRFNWNGAAEKYRQHMVKLYGTLRVLGKPEPVPLEGVFTDVFMLDQPMAARRFDISQLRQDPSPLHSARRASGLRLVAQAKHKRLFILGKPGAGKTTFLKHITLQAAQDKLSKIPIFVSLKEWSDSGLGLMPFMVRQFEICAFPDAQHFIIHILKTGRAIVLFDALDEVNQEGDLRKKIIAVLESFGKEYPQTQILVTCRIAASDYAFEQFTYVELADFNDEQMRSYAGKWFKDNPVKRDKFLQEFAREEQRSLRELGRVPLLLSLLCLNFDETMAFPQRRVEIYEEALDALLKKWDVSRNIQRDEIYRKLSLGRKRQMFARLAAETFERGEYFMEQADLAGRIVAYLRQLPPVDQGEDIDGDAVLKAIEAQHSIFVERAYHIYSFAHLTFQEYYAARYIADNASPQVLQDVLGRHLGDNRWREVFLLTASLLDNADAFFAAFRQVIENRILKEQTGAVSKTGQASTALVTLLQWAARKAAQTNAPYKPAAVRSAYVFLALDFTLDHARDLAHTLDRALDLSYVLDYALDYALERARDLVRVLAGELSTDFNLSYALQFAHVFGAVRPDNFRNVYSLAPKFAAYWDDVTRSIGPDEMPQLRQELAALSVPTQQDEQAAWRAFARNLQRVLIEQRDVGHEWDLSNEQYKQLAGYLEANQLLVDCLQLAVVSNRAAIENSLLQLPWGG